MIVGYTVGIKDVNPIPNTEDILILRHSELFINDIEVENRLIVLGGGPQGILALTEAIYYSVGLHIHRTSNGGDSFVDLGGVGERLRHVGFNGRNRGIAVGENARVINTINAGNFWLNNIIQSRRFII